MSTDRLVVDEAPPPNLTSGCVEVAAGRVYLHPGQYAVAINRCEMTTILGSCVAVCLHDPVARVGGCNHYLLPRAPRGAESFRFGDVAVRRLIEAVERVGGVPTRLQAKVIGGACVLDAFRGRSELGRQNVRIALEVLSQAGIELLALEVGGEHGRRIVFRPHTGDLVIKSL